MGFIIDKILGRDKPLAKTVKPAVIKIVDETTNTVNIVYTDEEAYLSQEPANKVKKGNQ